MAKQLSTRTRRMPKFLTWLILIAVATLMTFGCEEEIVNSVTDEPARGELPLSEAQKMQDGKAYADAVTPPDDMDDVYPEVIIMSELPDWPTRYFELNSAEIEGDQLIVSVSYAGGARRHYFRLVSTKLLDESPSQVNAQIFHFDNEDPADRWITEVRQFDLSPLKEMVFESYEQVKARLLINLIDAFSTQESAPLIYDFSDFQKNRPPKPPLPKAEVNGTW